MDFRGYFCLIKKRVKKFCKRTIKLIIRGAQFMNSLKSWFRGLRGKLLFSAFLPVIASVVATYGAELAPVISQVIARWDGAEAAERIELHVGRDLQFIRINGTIVGGLAGLVIHSLAQLAG